MSPNATLSPARVAALLLPPLIVMGVIFFLSAQTERSGRPRVVGRAAAKARALHRVRGADSALVAGACGVSACGFRSRVAMAISLGYAATDEFHQTFVDGRKGTPVDVLIDSAGIATAAR